MCMHFVHAHVCMCVSLYVYACVHVCTHTCICACTCVHMCMFLCVHAYMLMCMCMHVHACTYLCVHVCVCLCTHMQGRELDRCPCQALSPSLALCPASKAQRPPRPGAPSPHSQCPCLSSPFWSSSLSPRCAASFEASSELAWEPGQGRQDSWGPAEGVSSSTGWGRGGRVPRQHGTGSRSLCPQHLRLLVVRVGPGACSAR